MFKLNKFLYHGTSAAAAIYIYGGDGFNAPVYLTEKKNDAIHYAKAATAYLEDAAKEKGIHLIKEGYALFTFRSVPDITYLKIDDYNPGCELNQWKYLNRIKGLRHFKVEFHILDVSEGERLRLCCFAIGMWRG